jgi:hypothetical protein
MDSFSVFSQKEPIVMIHRGWRIGGASKAGGKTGDISSQPRAGKIAVKHPDSMILKNTTVQQDFEFVNGTDPFRNKDPEVRKLVRAHVVKDATRKRSQQKQEKSKLEKGGQESLVDNKEQEKRSHLTSRLMQKTIRRTENTSEVNRANEYSTSMIPSAGLDPHPELSPTIYHVATIATAMWPLEPFLRFNPISPILWFDWALNDEALLHALLYTTCSSAGLISGTTEDRNAIFHVGKSLRLINERLGGFEEVSETIIGAASCLALAEVSWSRHGSRSS